MSQASVSNNKQIVERFFEAMNAGDIEAIVDAYAQDGQLHTMGQTLISGSFTREQIAESAGRIYEVFPQGIRFDIIDMVGDGDKVAVEATSEGEHVAGQTYSN